MVTWSWPIPMPPGVITSPFGWRLNPLYPRHSTQQHVFHPGLDIGTGRYGDAVHAMASGVVKVEGWLLQPYSDPKPAGAAWAGVNYGGVMAVIDHGEGWLSVYAHLDRTIVDAGQRVGRGEQIGVLGASGSAQIGGAHLHLELWLNGQKRDPAALLSGTTLPNTPVSPETREERLARVAIARRLLTPAAAAIWVSSTGMTQDIDGQPLTRERRLSAEVTYLRLAAAIGDAEAARVAGTADNDPR